MTELYINGPRMLSSERPTILLISTPEPDATFSSGTLESHSSILSQPNLGTNSSPTQEFSVLLGVAHVAMDGVGTHMSCQVFLELLGGLSGKTGQVRTEEQLMCILEDEWNLRYGGPRPVYVLPPSVEERAPPYDAVTARADFLADQASYVVSSSLRRSINSLGC